MKIPRNDFFATPTVVDKEGMRKFGLDLMPSQVRRMHALLRGRSGPAAALPPTARRTEH